MMRASSSTWGLWHPFDPAGEAERVELKVMVPDRASRFLRAGSGDVRVRQVYFLETADLALSRHGLVVRIRSTASRSDDAVVKLRPMGERSVPGWLRRADLDVEIDALPGHRVCSAALKVSLGRRAVSRAIGSGHRLTGLLSARQRRMIEVYGPDGLDLDDLLAFGPVEVRRHRVRPRGLGRPMTAERWTYPDGSTLVELSTRCAADRAPEVAARMSAVLHAHGVVPSRRQRTKTEMTLRYFSAPAA
ncbi:hypothetical protein AB0M02_14705 [Actinoplanes sp. NPDC051861]|uniref:hypothetical protein n=1 Tax=Actinoplanes sp. NPDC051861 TaxID=3155170 RepID=UPI00342378FB